MQPRTKRQREVFDYITTFIEERGYEPSYQQIARHFRIASKSAIAKHITALENQGLLSRFRENGSFGLQIRSQNVVSDSICEIQWLELPFDSELAEEWELGALSVPKFLIGYASPERFRAFRVRNNSMLNEQICENDIVLIEKRSYARDGDSIVALIGKNRVVLKKFFRIGGNVELRPANDNYDSIHLSAENVLVQGVVRGLLRLIS